MLGGKGSFPGSMMVVGEAKFVAKFVVDRRILAKI
jgi:hypothetical protein